VIEMPRQVTIFYLVSGRDTFSGTGIDRVSRSLFNGLNEIADGAFKLVPVTIDDKGSITLSQSLTTCYENTSDQPRLEPEKGDIVLSVDLVYNLSDAGKLRLCALQKEGVKLCFVLYDLIPVRRPDWFATDGDVAERKAYLRQFQSWVDWVFTNADCLCCISKFVSEDAALWKQERSIGAGPMLSWFHLGCDFSPSTGQSHYTKETSRSGPLEFLVVGTLEPRKSQALVLDAFELLWKNNVQDNLVIAGRSGKPWMSNYQSTLVQRVEQHPELNKRLHFIDGPTDRLLQDYYRRSDALIMASEDEGFGLPLIEAAQYGLPVIARDILVFREICGGSAYYFRADKAADLANAVVEWSTLFKSGMHPRSSQLRFNTWRQSAQQLLEGLRLAGCPC
jgi:glycosyltransferase involved in cell wall biosynthesis